MIIHIMQEYIRKTNKIHTSHSLKAMLFNNQIIDVSECLE